MSCYFKNVHRFSAGTLPTSHTFYYLPMVPRYTLLVSYLINSCLRADIANFRFLADEDLSILASALLIPRLNG
jgi:hypothetical protein